MGEETRRDPLSLPRRERVRVRVFAQKKKRRADCSRRLRVRQPTMYLVIRRLAVAVLLRRRSVVDVEPEVTQRARIAPVQAEQYIATIVPAPVPRKPCKPPFSGLSRQLEKFSVVD